MNTTSNYFFEEEKGDNITTKKSSFLRRKMSLILVVLGVIFMIAGILVNRIKVDQNKPGVVEKNGEGQVSGEDFSRKPVVVHIDGAIERPGLYTLPYDSRIQDVLISAGGLTAKANRNYVSKNINLAQRAYDGMKIYIPEDNEVDTTKNGVVKSAVEKRSDVAGIISVGINSASQESLESLPGIGPVTAKKMIEARPYTSVEQLRERKVVSNSVFEKIKSLITLD